MESQTKVIFTAVLIRVEHEHWLERLMKMSYKSEKILIETDEMAVGELRNFEVACPEPELELKQIINSNRLKKVGRKTINQLINNLSFALND